MLDEAIKASILFRGQSEDVVLSKIISQISKFKSYMKYTLRKPKMQKFLTNLLQQFIDSCIPLRAANNLYFKILEMQIDERVEFFTYFFEYYETRYTIIVEGRKCPENLFYKINLNQYSSPNAEFLTLNSILNESKAIIPNAHERIQFYRYLIEDISNTAVSQVKTINITNVLNDLLELHEFELFKTYITTFDVEFTFKSNEQVRKYNFSMVDNACKVHSLDIVKYLIETLGLSYHPFGVIRYPTPRPPIVTAVLIHRNHNHNHNYNYHDHHRHNNTKRVIRSDKYCSEEEEIEYQKQQSLKIVEYLVDVYKRNKKEEELFREIRIPDYQYTQFVTNCIVRVAYQNANIPVLLYLKRIDFNIAKIFNLVDAVKSADLQTVTLFWNEYRSLYPHLNFDNGVVDENISDALEAASMLESLEIFNTFEKFGVDYSLYPIILGAGRFEILSHFDFKNSLMKVEDTDNDYDDDDADDYIFNLLERIFNNLLSSEYFSLQYLDALLIRYPFLKSFFSLHVVEYFEYGNFKLIILKNLISALEVCPFIFQPIVENWASKLSFLAKNSIFNSPHFFDPNPIFNTSTRYLTINN